MKSVVVSIPLFYPSSEGSALTLGDDVSPPDGDAVSLEGEFPPEGDACPVSRLGLVDTVLDGLLGVTMEGVGVGEDGFVDGGLEGGAGERLCEGGGSTGFEGVGLVTGGDDFCGVGLGVQRRLGAEDGSERSG
jgi:hypothetical protein